MAELFGEITPGLLLLMILALVELAKQANITGNKLIGLSVLVGMVLVGLYELISMYPGAAPAVRVVVYGVLLGLTATGLYKLGANFVQRARGET